MTISNIGWNFHLYVTIKLQCHSLKYDKLKEHHEGVSFVLTTSIFVCQSHGFIDRIWSPISWRERDTSNRVQFADSVILLAEFWLLL